MDQFDIATVRFFNELVHRSPYLDAFLIFLVSNTALKGVLFASLTWWAWFRPERSTTSYRRPVLATILACIASLSISQALQLLLPFRMRPVFVPILDLRMPFAGLSDYLTSFSSFPSDHASLFYAWATGFYLVSRSIGVILLVHVTVLICLPRIILGLHFPTDVMAGALIGVNAVYLVNTHASTAYLMSRIRYWEEKSAGTFYACFFLLTYLFATMFEPIRSVFKFIRSVV